MRELIKFFKHAKYGFSTPQKAIYHHEKDEVFPISDRGKKGEEKLKKMAPISLLICVCGIAIVYFGYFKLAPQVNENRELFVLVCRLGAGLGLALTWVFSQEARLNSYNFNLVEDRREYRKMFLSIVFGILLSPLFGLLPFIIPA